MNFYVYEHWRSDKNECFYVGKGRGNRARSMLGRNVYHQRIKAKADVCVVVVARNLSEESAFALEVARIAFWRGLGAGLTNMTNGGDGVSGRKLSAESRAKISQSNLGRVWTEEQKMRRRGHAVSEKTKQSVRAANTRNRYRRGQTSSEETKQRVREAQLCDRSVANWRAVSGMGPAALSKRVKRVMCVTDGKEFASASEAARFYGMAISSISNAARPNHEQKTAGGRIFKYLDTA